MQITFCIKKKFPIKIEIAVPMVAPTAPYSFINGILIPTFKIRLRTDSGIYKSWQSSVYDFVADFIWIYLLWQTFYKVDLINNLI